MQADQVTRAGVNRGALVLLMLVSFFYVMDRQILSILAEEIRRDLLLSDVQIGLMSGFAFAAFYSSLALPLARVADRHDRRLLISGSLALWSAFTAAAAFAQNFAQLFLARALVGVGEAGSGPAVQSLVADLVAKERRAFSLAFVGAGLPLGTLGGLAIGGLVADFYGWRAAFVAAGLPGLALAVLAVTILRDPRQAAGQKAGPVTEGFTTTVRGLVSKRSFILIAAAATLVSITSLSLNAFVGSFFFRNHASSLTGIAAVTNQILGTSLGPTALLGILLGLALGLGGFFGILIGGKAADLARPRDPASYATVPAVAALAAGPLYAAVLLAGSMGGAIALLFIPALLAASVIAPAVAASQSLVSPSSRATAAALLFLTTNFIGLGIGPPAVGYLSDLFASSLDEAAGLRLALLVACLGCPAAALCFWAARAPLVREMVS